VPQNLPGAQRTFVSAESGSDLNSCTRSAPCRSFSAAIPFTDPDGEVIAIDSGGYGGVTIPQSISIISPKGVQAGITASSGTAITVNAGDSAHVVLKNLYLSSLGALNGSRRRPLPLEGCTLNGFQDGILFDPTTANTSLAVSDCIIRRSTLNAIYVAGQGTRATIDSVQLSQNLTGVHVEAAQATVRNGVASAGSSGTARVSCRISGFVRSENDR